MCGRLTVKVRWAEIVALYRLMLDRTLIEPIQLAA
jgi:hypothetical protein